MLSLERISGRFYDASHFILAAKFMWTRFYIIIYINNKLERIRSGTFHDVSSFNFLPHVTQWKALQLKEL
jgi:hypothetical protein